LWIKKGSIIQADYVTDDSKKLAEKYCIEAKGRNSFWKMEEKSAKFVLKDQCLAFYLLFILRYVSEDLLKVGNNL
jgi:hypothetical protein